MLIGERPYEATPLEVLSAGAHRLPNPVREPDPSVAEEQSQNVISSLLSFSMLVAIVVSLRQVRSCQASPLQCASADKAVRVPACVHLLLSCVCRARGDRVRFEGNSTMTVSMARIEFAAASGQVFPESGLFVLRGLPALCHASPAGRGPLIAVAADETYKQSDGEGGDSIIQRVQRPSCSCSRSRLDISPPPHAVSGMTHEAHKY